MNDLVQFNVSASKLGHQAFGLRIDGELDLFSASEVHDELVAITPEVRYVLVDLTGMTFMDSAGLAILLAGAKALADRNGKMLLVVGERSVLRVLEVTGLNAYFEIRDDFETAAREFVGLKLAAS
jgi:anti-sigma B factor antagonist